MEQITGLNEIKVNYSSKPNKNTITCSKMAYEVSKAAYSLTESNISLKEYFFLILLNRANKVIGFYKVSEGGLAGTIADIRLTFSVALKCLASGIIIVHNHPSGSLEASQADINLTRKFKDAGSLLDIQVTDHLIVTENAYSSFADEGLL